jgi:hypothetical protein
MNRILMKLCLPGIALALLPGCTQFAMITKLKSGTPALLNERCVIPFQLVGHRIYVKTRLNDALKEYNFIFDTGALTAVDIKVAEELGLGIGREIPTPDKTIKAYLAQKDVTIVLGTVWLADFIVPLFDFAQIQDEEDQYPAIDGFIGSDFARFYRVTIDYRSKSLVFSPRADLPDSSTALHRIPFEQHIPIRAPTVECTIDGDIVTKGIIDTGSPFFAVFPLSLLEKQRFPDERELLKSVGVMAEWPFWPIEHNYLARIRSLKVGSLELQDVIVLYANTKNILLGEKFLSQFVVSLHFPEHEMVLIPYGDGAFEHNVFSTGLKLMREEGKTIIASYWEGSPADRAGISVQDEVLEIDGRNTSDVPVGELQAVLRNNSVETVQLLLKTENGEREVVIEKEMLFPDGI